MKTVGYPLSESFIKFELQASADNLFLYFK